MDQQNLQISYLDQRHPGPYQLYPDGDLYDAEGQLIDDALLPELFQDFVPQLVAEITKHVETLLGDILRYNTDPEVAKTLLGKQFEKREFGLTDGRLTSECAQRIGQLFIQAGLPDLAGKIDQRLRGKLLLGELLTALQNGDFLRRMTDFIQKFYDLLRSLAADRFCIADIKPEQEENDDMIVSKLKSLHAVICQRDKANALKRIASGNFSDFHLSTVIRANRRLGLDGNSGLEDNIMMSKYNELERQVYQKAFESAQTHLAEIRRQPRYRGVHSSPAHSLAWFSLKLATVEGNFSLEDAEKLGLSEEEQRHLARIIF